MTPPKIDKYATAVANGYSPSQAEALADWTDFAFVTFMNEMILPSHIPKKSWIFEKTKKA